ncbi:hypothetical protein [Pseudobacteriovorax antillogorgiicola]|uniref:Uncharacterized protein involved in exopolysaccharide biosynthesis n=1 Tax=Pseudobacteriovorax antillogorgiicola TaxID=1513793 RepID=A0A1Y6BU64_9BACT|nr:hypothetical protein [Pseudobacteriovorax antillogorgiicola]TCS54547.1 uncharacterized protein involved in exopolysaccharide biosynthesis [Pseudobacteriovorax antillogorgiicola]SMF18515.1 Uncharacterized protein involved in exopolysaccharide biosynthesis [Pseudobacteriovorax antillogorgiicola]
MKNRTDEFNQNEEDWQLAGPLPDLVYLKKLFKRHILFAIQGIVLSLVVAIGIALTARNVFESKIHAVFDQTDISGSGLGVSSQASYNIVSRLFLARFNSQEFLYKIGKDLHIIDELRKPRFPYNLLGAEPSVPETQEEIIAEKLAVVDYMKKHLKVEAEPYTGILNLYSYADTPAKAAKLATVAMNDFIKQELEFQLESVEKKLALLETGVESVTLIEEDDSSQDTSASQPDRLKKLQIREQESRLEDDLKRVTSELNSNQVKQKNLEAAHKADLEKLLGSLQPSHPTVQSKERTFRVEMGALKTAEAKLIRNAEEMRRELWRTRVNKVRTEGTMVPTGEGLTYQGAFFIAVSDRIKDLSLEKKNLIRQINDPDQRTRIKILFPSTLERVPFKSNRRKMAMVISVIGGMIVLALVLLREIRNPIARDDWRILRRNGQPILTQIALESRKQFERITPQDADSLRSLFAQGNPNEEGLRTLLSYRRLELAVSQNCTGNIILLTSSGSRDELGSSIFSFLNILATDTNQRVLAIDFNGYDPICPNIEPKNDVIDVIQKKCSLESIIQKGGNETHQFDVIPPFREYAGERTRVFTYKNLSSIIDSVKGSYDLMFLRSFPESQFTENVVLSNIASDSLVCVDAERTSFNELDRTITHIDSEKLRGLVLVGT